MAVIGALAGCAGTPEDGDDDAAVSDRVVPIGLLLPAGGANKAIGDDMRRGFDLYLNQHGNTLGGHRVRVETADEGDTPDSGRAGLAALLDKKVSAVAGVAAPEVLSALRDPIRTARVPLIGVNGSPASLQGEIFIWRTSYVGTDPGIAMGRYMAENVPGRVAMVLPDLPAGQDVLDGFRDGFGTDGRLDREPVFAGTATNPRRGAYAELVERLRDRRPAAVFCALTGPAAVEFVRAFRAAGLGAGLYGPGFLTEGTGIAESGQAGLGIATALNYSADLPHAANRIFASAYRKAHGASPTTYAMAAYDAAAVLDRAILLARDDLSAQNINLNLGRVGQVDSPRGVWQFNQSRTPQQKWYLREVRADGQVTSNVVTRELATLG
ncbi:ABC transporter substrate-binding protein [Pilimelia anulata]|uniref:ABC transporter substrate-binding protein n=1 Tax=Pilimelia anulata TaxID=53371 RepID=UPI001E4704DC|nr:ABC transporter substrate-binding protein [Pilimelia anulata]